MPTRLPLHFRLQQQQARQGRSRPLFRLLLGVIALGVASTVFVGWYLQHELPVAQRRAKESEALLAPPSRSFCSRSRPPMVCAHGGDTTHAPPNTVSAFRASLAAGADCVEVDAALSSDGLLVVMHVRELAQLLGRSGVQVGDLSGSELLSLRWPSGEAVMSVEEAVRLTSPFVGCVTLDVKTYNDKSGAPLDEDAIAAALVRLVAATRCSNCLIWAKSDRVVRRVLELSPGQRTGYIVMNETAESRQLGMQHPLRFGGTRTVEVAELATAGAIPPQRQRLAERLQPPRALNPSELRERELAEATRSPAEGGGRGVALARAPPPTQQPAVVGVHWAMVEPELLDQLHGAGKQLFAWTINQAEVLRAALDVGVDAIVTNYPLTALEAIESRLTKCGALAPGGGAKPRSRARGGSGGGSGGDGLSLGDYL
ncbi:hypothetical protein GPECTOR_5g136 [Gonium pectorale]|uniref:glycerophosphodiester phosphodiesterase n=1 Tax=Gonium pectorale TaxID=33097 RepID=A0A150GVX1_GONPE|nr:hypothetical protein GPECTOR_5g136 [Gonium pectorale]|eukprot:KXZ54026.1 hypothetical protein GPECTOR_5g136 [Gonium pectorale]